jgi:hypothetical protein
MVPLDGRHPLLELPRRLGLRRSPERLLHLPPSRLVDVVGDVLAAGGVIGEGKDVGDGSVKSLVSVGDEDERLVGEGGEGGWDGSDGGEGDPEVSSEVVPASAVLGRCEAPSQRKDLLIGIDPNGDKEDKRRRATHLRTVEGNEPPHRLEGVTARGRSEEGAVELAVNVGLVGVGARVYLAGRAERLNVISTCFVSRLSDVEIKRALLTSCARASQENSRTAPRPSLPTSPTPPSKSLVAGIFTVTFFVPLRLPSLRPLRLLDPHP